LIGDATLKKLILAKNNRLIVYAILAVLILLLPIILSGSEYVLLIICLAQVYIIAVSGLDIVFGYSGQISMGHAAFFAIGAYGSALLRNYFGLPILLTMIASSIIATIVGALLAYPASKLVFHFLSLATIAFNYIIYNILLHSPGGITGDFSGLFSDRFEIFGHIFNSIEIYYAGLLCVVIFLLAKAFMVDSKTGRAFIAIRENPHAANGMGINVRKYKVMAFSISAFYTAFAGGMYVHLIGFIHPDMFIQRTSVQFITMLLFGGTATILGPIIGVVSIQLILELLRSLKDFQYFIYGALLLLVIVALPGGIYGGLKDIVAKVKLMFLKNTSD
jgi:branched-chain amino acid transport system permease protein